MPQDLLTDATPCAAQVEVMQSHGFKYDRETDNEKVVTWRGHGVILELFRHAEISPGNLADRIARTARQNGILTIRKAAWKLLGLPEMRCPVPFELVEMDAATEHKS